MLKLREHYTPEQRAVIRDNLRAFLEMPFGGKPIIEAFKDREDELNRGFRSHTSSDQRNHDATILLNGRLDEVEERLLENFGVEF